MILKIIILLFLLIYHITQVIRNKFDTHHDRMETLSLEENDLKEHIPAGTAIQESNIVTELRNLMEQVSKLNLILN